MPPAAHSDAEEEKPKILAKHAPLDEKENNFVAEHSPRANKCEYGVFGNASTTEDQNVDVLGFDERACMAVVKAEDVDATEQSSSFGNTFSGDSDEGLKISSSDMEVESPLFVDSFSQRPFGGPVRLFKKKKVTAHWRKFISPIMWRCHWLELRMKELQSQALRYDKELAAYLHEKQLRSKMIDLNGSVSRSAPLTCKSCRKPAVKRRKRRRNEDVIDVAHYMANHNIFSYYENKKSETDGLSIDDDFSNQVDEIMRDNDDHLWALDFRDGDRTLEDILLNIESLQSRVLKIKAHLCLVISRNARVMTAGCSVVGDPPISSVQSPSCSLGNNGNQMLVGVPNTPPHHASVNENEDMALPGSANSSFGDASDFVIIESAMGFLSGADGPLNANQLEDICKDDVDDVLINNQAADEELQSFEVRHGRKKSKEIETAREPNSDDESTAPCSMEATTAGQSHEGEGFNASQQPILKPCYTGKRRGRKPKRRRRGGSVAGWRAERLQKKRRVSG
ncbi:hypothetical protein HPP92_005941 [Vanilla planifolia]|uniref:Uncharacterized protein n=1 Tax=Vanilla planifolia TaxID=51239 RepID=A0A835VDN6_VANPL|nr:hypothetical protein HPP92_006226 [Vanilla planifolia]KAG0494947.1 hypothetical protein HPP92_005941 [Vanilla planifolia]